MDARGKGRPKGSGKYYQQFRVRLTDEQKEKLWDLAKRDGTTVSDILRKIVEEAFERS